MTHYKGIRSLPYGIWPSDMATLFPDAHILGVDVALSSLPHPLPTSCLFSQANILQSLPFPDRQFDFTHQRLLVAAISTAQWPAVVHELVRVTRPGGWIELLEIGDTIQHAGPATTRLDDPDQQDPGLPDGDSAPPGHPAARGRL